MAEKNDKIDLNNIEYLTFEGGGGKGIVYMGVVRELEKLALIKREVLNKKKSNSPIDEDPNDIPLEEVNTTIDTSDEIIPLFSIGLPIEDRLFKGISGASAGAITAFMLAMGMTSEDVQSQFDKTIEGKIAGEKMELSVFEKFFDDSNPYDYRATKNKRALQDVDDNSSSNIITSGKKEDLTFLSKWLSVVEKILNKKMHYLQFSDDMAIKKIVLSGFKRWTDRGYYKGYRMIFKKKRQRKTFLWDGHKSQKELYKQFREYTYSLIHNRGVFPGFEVIKYLNGVLKEFLQDRIFTKVEGFVKLTDLNGHSLVSKNPETITFHDFFNLTGVDLVITGTNVSQGIPKYFSVTHTPDFPVVYAVAISMNLPFIFRPFYIGDDVHKGMDSSYNVKYNGLWVDGGMLNNFPLRAFDQVESLNYIKGNKGTKRPLLLHGKELSKPVAIAVAATEETDFCNCVLGFQIYDILKKENDETKGSRAIYQESFNLSEGGDIENNFHGLPSLQFLSQLYNTFMYPAEEGQIRTLEEKRHSIGISANGLELTDFASPKLNKIRKAYYDEKADFLLSKGLRKSQVEWIRDLAKRNGRAAERKEDLIDEAIERVKEYVTVNK